MNRVGEKVACSRLRDSGEKSFSKKKWEKRTGAGERQGRPLSQVARVLFSLCSFNTSPLYYLRAWHRLIKVRLGHRAANSMLPGNAKWSMTSLADTKHIFRERKIYLFIYLWSLEFRSWLRPHAVSRLRSRFTHDKIIKSLRSLKKRQSTILGGNPKLPVDMY